MLLCADPSSDQEEPDSAFEATQYFFEDITPECTHGTGLYLRSLLFHDRINFPISPSNINSKVLAPKIKQKPAAVFSLNIRTVDLINHPLPFGLLEGKKNHISFMVEVV